MAEEVISQPGGDKESAPSGEKQHDDRTRDDFEPSEDEKTVVNSWLQRVQRAEDQPQFKAWRDQLETLRGYMDGTKHNDKSNTPLVRTNMVFSTIAASIPEVYAKNPEIACTPTDAVAPDQMGMVKKFCETAEKVIRKLLVEEAKLKKRAKSNVRSTSATGFGVLKMLYQHSYHGDPIAVRRIEDTQDNLARVEALVRELKKIDDKAEAARKRDELRANLESLKASNEVKIWKGFSLDRMKSEDFLILDENVDEFDEYENAAALGHKIWMRVADFKSLMRMSPHGATRYGAPRGDEKIPDKTPADEQFVCVIEIWDKQAGVVRTTAKGMNRWCRDPYAPQHPPQRWYPFYVLGFNLLEGRWRPISDVELLMGLQDEYNTTRTNYADVREKAVPVLIFRKAGNLTKEDIENITNRGNKDTIGVEGVPTVPIKDDIVYLETPKIDPMAYDVTMVRNDMDLVVGRSDASRANLIKPKTATEAEIMQEAMATRTAERRDSHEDLLSEMGEAALEISLRCLSKAEVAEIAGAEAEWPDTAEGVDEIFRQVMVRVRAGSSGKPNVQKNREQWTQLQPIISESMVKVAELRASGNIQLAESTLELLRITLKRFDETLDLDALIPPVGDEQQLMQQLQQDLAQAQEQIAGLTEELAKTKEALLKAQAGEQVQLKKQEFEQQSMAAEAQRAEQRTLEEESAASIEAEKQAQRDHELKLEQERTKQEQIRADEAKYARELEHKERMAKLDREAEDRRAEADRVVGERDRAADRESVIETEKIKAQATEEDKAVKDAVTKGEKERVKRDEKFTEVLAAFTKAIDALRETTAELAEVSGADRVPEYDPVSGMPTRMRVDRKKKEAH